MRLWLWPIAGIGKVAGNEAMDSPRRTLVVVLVDIARMHAETGAPGPSPVLSLDC